METQTEQEQEPSVMLTVDELAEMGVADEQANELAMSLAVATKTLEIGTKVLRRYRIANQNLRKQNQAQAAENARLSHRLDAVLRPCDDHWGR